MAKKIHQFRFYQDDSSDERNSPRQGEYDSLGGMKGFTNGEVFKKYYPFYQLGIQTLPGTKIYLNGAEEPVLIGATGIYELDLQDGVKVTTLEIGGDSISVINDAADGYLIVDVIYDDEGGES